MNQKERMIAGLPYRPWLDGLPEEHLAAKKKCYEYNHLDPEDADGAAKILKDLLGKTGDWLKIEQPFHCDYGYNIEVGEWFFANYNFVVLDN